MIQSDPRRHITVVHTTEQQGHDHLFGFICTPETSRDILRELGKIAAHPEQYQQRGPKTYLPGCGEGSRVGTAKLFDVDRTRLSRSAAIQHRGAVSPSDKWRARLLARRVGITNML